MGTDFTSPSVCVAGVGQTGPVREDARSIPEMVLDAVEKALADASLTYADIDAVVSASVDLFDGLTASNIAVTEVAGAVMKPETRISADGLAALIHGVCQIQAGAYQTVLVVAHGKASMSKYQELTSWAMDPIYLGALGVDFLTCAGLQARALTGGDDSGAEQRWADIASKRQGSAAEYGFAGASSPEEILSSPFVASPLRAKMCAPLGDGAIAVLISAQEALVNGREPISLAGVGHDLSAHALWDESLLAWPGLSRAYARACNTADIAPASASFDFLEPSCLFPHEEELFAKAIGVSDGSALSPAGGLFGGTAPIAVGLSRLAAAVGAMRSKDGPSRGLAHGTWGPLGQGQAVAILEKAA